jgi:hypothetical protein
MIRKRNQERSVEQRVANRGRERHLTRVDAFTRVAGHAFDLRVDIGFGDAVEPPAALDFDGALFSASLRAILERRGTRPDLHVPDELRTELAGRRWQTDWATMLREKAVAQPMELADAIARFDGFVRPLLEAAAGAAPPGTWSAPGPSWS